MRKGLNIFIMEILFAIFGKELIKNTYLFLLLELLLNHSYQFYFIEITTFFSLIVTCPFRINKSPFREKESFTHFSVTDLGTILAFS